MIVSNDHWNIYPTNLNLFVLLADCPLSWCFGSLFLTAGSIGLQTLQYTIQSLRLEIVFFSKNMIYGCKEMVYFSLRCEMTEMLLGVSRV